MSVHPALGPRHIQQFAPRVIPYPEGATLHAVKSAFQREGVPTPGGGRYWHVGTIRDLIRNDVFRAHGRDELKRLVESGNLSSEVLAGLDSKQR